MIRRFSSSSSSTFSARRSKHTPSSLPGALRSWVSCPKWLALCPEYNGTTIGTKGRCVWDTYHHRVLSVRKRRSANDEKRKQMAIKQNIKTMTEEDLPRTIENSVTGERVTFLATAEETNGEYVRIRNETSAGAPGVVMHYHLAYTEAFEVLQGSLDVCLASKDNHLVLAEGESVFVPLNTAHRFWNPSTEPVVFEVEIRPARNFEKAIRAQFGLVKDGKTDDKGGSEEHPRAGPDLRALRELHSRHAPGLAEGGIRSAG